MLSSTWLESQSLAVWSCLTWLTCRLNISWKKKRSSINKEYWGNAWLRGRLRWIQPQINEAVNTRAAWNYTGCLTEINTISFKKRQRFCIWIMAVFAVGGVQRRIYRPASFHFNRMQVWGCLLVLTCVKCVSLYVVGLTTVEESRHGSEPVGHTRSVRWKGLYCRLSKPTFAMLCLGCPSLPLPHTSVVCSETHEAPSLIHVSVWMNMQTLIRRSAHITFAYRLAWEKCSCIFSTSFFFCLGSNPGSRHKMDWYNQIWLSSVPQFQQVSASQHIYNSF